MSVGDEAQGNATLVTIQVDGTDVLALPGEALGLALLKSGILTLRRSPNAGSRRGMFCLMGVCQECVVRVNGLPRLACREPVVAGMRISTGNGHG